jgi:peptidoglycan/xylan/chitin deacetylase (PgdA/CDA1 family)
MNARRATKRLAAPVAGWAADRLAPRDALPVAILGYHGVSDEAVPEHVGKSEFRAQMGVIATSGRCKALEFVLDQLDGVRQGGAASLPPVVLTFDDGYANVLDRAVPVLTELSIPATVFVVPGKLGQVADWPSPAPSANRLLMSRAQVDAILEVGLSIGAHGWTHADLTACSPQQLADELGQCLDFLRGQLGVRSPVFCYPWGRYDARVVREVGTAGFAGAVTGDWGRWHRASDRFTLRRVAIDSHDTLRDFLWKQRGGWGWWTGSWWRELRRAGGRA